MIGSHDPFPRVALAGAYHCPNAASITEEVTSHLRSLPGREVTGAPR